MPSSTPARNAAAAQSGQSQSRADAYKTGLSLGSLALLGLVPTALLGQACVGGAPRLLLWALGLWVSGVALGFLFGIPRVLQGRRAPSAKGASGQAADEKDQPDAEASPAYQQRVNTNLEEISDWLTKIIVGMGLVELRSMPEHIQRLGAEIVGTSAAPCDPTLGAALAVFFSVVGFLFGYLVTRLYIQGALARAETDVATLTALSALELRAESAEAELKAVKAVAVLPQPRAAAEAAVAQEPSPEQLSGLQALADQYRAITISDYRARVAAKDDLAARMAKYVVEQGVSREWLADQQDEALILGLATVVQAFPRDGDGQRLVRAAAKVRRLHIRYKVLLALAKLSDIGALRGEDRPAASQLLDTFAAGADTSLSNRIESLREKLRSRS